jgi:twitching motility protein PilT
MFVSPPIRRAIEDAEDGRIADLIASGKEDGMLTWTQSYVDMINKGFVEKKVARQFAPNKDALEMALKGIDIAQRSFG